MTIRERLRNYILPEQPKDTTDHVAIAEAAGDVYASSENPFNSNFWPSVSGTEPIVGLNLQRAFRIQTRLFEQNPIHRRVHEIIRDFTWGQGLNISVTAKEDETDPDNTLQSVCKSILARVNETYSGSKNRLDLKLPQLILERSLYGTLGLPVAVEAQSGECTFGYIPATWIKDIRLSDVDATQPVAIFTAKGTWKDKSNDVKWDKKSETCLEVLRIDTSPNVQDKATGQTVQDKEGNRVPNPHYGKIVGQCFLFRSNHLVGQAYGRGDTFAISDHFNYLDQAIYDSVTALEVQRGVVSDVTIKNGSKDEVSAWSKIRIPRNKIFAHTDRVSLEMKSPAIKMDEVTALIRMLLLICVGSAGIPEFVLGDGSQTNVATAVEQMPALYAKFNHKRSEWASDLQFLFRYAMEQQNAAGMIRDEAGNTKHLTQAELDRIDINIDFLPFERNNIDRIADSIQKVASGLQVLEETNLISQETARKTAWAVLSQVGVEIDGETEKARLADQDTTGTSTTGRSNDMQDVIKTKGA